MNNYKKHFIFLFLYISTIGLGSDLYAQTDYIINNDNAEGIGHIGLTLSDGFYFSTQKG